MNDTLEIRKAQACTVEALHDAELRAYVWFELVQRNVARRLRLPIDHTDVLNDPAFVEVRELVLQLAGVSEVIEGHQP